MAKKGAKQSKATVEDLHAVVRALAAETAGPLTMTMIVKAVGDRELAVTTVADLVGEKALFEVAPKTGKGQATRYAAVDPLEAARKELLEGTSAPIDVAGLQKQLSRAPFPPSATAIARYLENEVQECRLLRVGVDDESKLIQYCRVSSLDRVASVCLAQEKPFTAKSILKSTKLSEASLNRVLELLVENRELFIHPASGKKTVDQYFREPTPKASVEALIQVLQSQKDLENNSYPVMYAHLMDLAGLPKSEQLDTMFRADKRVRVLGGKWLFAEDYIVEISKPAMAATLVEDRARRLRTDSRCGFTMGELAGDVELVPKADQSKLALAMKSAVESGACRLAWVATKVGPVVFAPSDIRNAPSSTVAVPIRATVPPAPPKIERPALPPDFGRDFDAAFDRLDARAGNHNFVSLVSLRAELSAWPRKVFDDGLLRLRRERRFTLARSEGQVNPEEQEAGIQEHGELFLFAKKWRGE